MPFHADEPHFVLRMSEANRLMKFAMRRSPEEYFEALSQPHLGILVKTAGEFTDAEYSEEYGEESWAIDLYLSGLKDVITPFSTVADQNLDLTKEHSLAIMTNPETIATYGLLASMTQIGLTHVTREAPDYFGLSQDGTALVLKQPVRTSPYYGCEAVDARSGQPEMSPIFKKFVSWAGSLTVHSYFMDKS